MRSRFVTPALHPHLSLRHCTPARRSCMAPRHCTAGVLYFSYRYYDRLGIPVPGVVLHRSADHPLINKQSADSEKKPTLLRVTPRVPGRCFPARSFRMLPPALFCCPDLSLFERRTIWPDAENPHREEAVTADPVPHPFFPILSPIPTQISHLTRVPGSSHIILIASVYMARQRKVDEMPRQAVPLSAPRQAAQHSAAHPGPPPFPPAPQKPLPPQPGT